MATLVAKSKYTCGEGGVSLTIPDAYLTGSETELFAIVWETHIRCLQNAIEMYYPELTVPWKKVL